MHFERWTEEYDEILVQALEAQMSIARIAYDMNRSRAAVASRARKLGYSGLDMRTHPSRAARGSKRDLTTS